MGKKTGRTAVLFFLLVLATASIATFTRRTVHAEQPPPPCHPNATADGDRATVSNRGDVKNLPGPMKDMLIRLADRPHSQLPVQAYAEVRLCLNPRIQTWRTTTKQ